jgi:hypothetical protein
MRGILKRNMPGNTPNNYTKRIAASEEEEEDGWLLPLPLWMDKFLHDAIGFHLRIRRN